MTCNRAKFLFDDYLFNRLDPETTAALEEHLRTCATCRDALENEKALVGLVQADRTPEPGDEYWGSLEKVILARTVRRIEPAAVETDISKGSRWRTLLNYVVPLAASIALLAGALTDLGLKPRGTAVSDLSVLGAETGIASDAEALCLNVQIKSHLLGSVIMSPPGSAGRGIKVSQMTIIKDVPDEHEK
ncbi:MAG: zf-HC2 domain-containing protein [Candidatus Zixiibacteriota bacterium]|nr:MAG: zf-HC2 domain-containing protein [candidate division Zixibacteria bacterium]